MKTELVSLEQIPNEEELSSLLGKKIHDCYNLLCEAIVSVLFPDIEIWGQAGRRGKYFHGYRINKLNTLIDLYLASNQGNGLLTCEFKLSTKSIFKIQKQKQDLSENLQESINKAMDNKKMYGGFYLDIIINEDNLQEVIQIIKILSD